MVLATADNFPDSLVGSVLAYRMEAPILLVGSSKSDEDKVMSYIKEYMDPSGTVFILGGIGAVKAYGKVAGGPGEFLPAWSI